MRAFPAGGGRHATCMHPSDTAHAAAPPLSSEPPPRADSTLTSISSRNISPRRRRTNRRRIEERIEKGWRVTEVLPLLLLPLRTRGLAPYRKPGRGSMTPKTWLACDGAPPPPPPPLRMRSAPPLPGKPGGGFSLFVRGRGGEAASSPPCVERSAASPLAAEGCSALGPSLGPCDGAARYASASARRPGRTGPDARMA